MGKMQREKGKRFEREVAALFREAGYDSHRTAQCRGNTGQAADIEGVPYIHIEAKHCEKMQLYDWIAQAVHDASKNEGGSLPVVIHRKNNAQMLVTMRACDWMELYRAYEMDKSSS